MNFVWNTAFESQVSESSHFFTDVSHCIDQFHNVVTWRLCNNIVNYFKSCKKQTKVIPSETSDNDISIAMEGLIISSDLKDNDKTHNKSKEKPLTDEFASFTPIFVSAIDNI